MTVEAYEEMSAEFTVLNKEFNVASRGFAMGTVTQEELDAAELKFVRARRALDEAYKKLVTGDK